jgi:hypothetical protein
MLQLPPYLLLQLAVGKLKAISFVDEDQRGGAVDQSKAAEEEDIGGDGDRLFTFVDEDQREGSPISQPQGTLVAVFYLFMLQLPPHLCCN